MAAKGSGEAGTNPGIKNGPLGAERGGNKWVASHRSRRGNELRHAFIVAVSRELFTKSEGTAKFSCCCSKSRSAFFLQIEAVLLVSPIQIAILS